MTAVFHASGDAGNPATMRSDGYVSLRRESGPNLSRVLLHHAAEGYAWIEQATPGGPYQGQLARVLEPCSGEDSPRWLKWATPIAGDSVIFAKLTVPDLLIDVLVARLDDQNGLRDLYACFSALGMQLAEWHWVGAKTIDPRLLPREGILVPEIVAALGRIQGAGNPIFDNVPELIAGASRAASLIESAPEPVVLHGRFSLGVIMPDDTSPRVMIGPDAWYGPPGFDVGYLTGELVELIAARRLAGQDAQILGELLDIFLEAYRSSVAAADFAAFRCVDHLMKMSTRGVATSQWLATLACASEGILCKLKAAHHVA